MANASFVDSLMGYRFFLSTRGKATQEEVNHHLISISRKPISIRTYTHYTKLLKRGFRNYIPINQFDVFNTLGRTHAASDRRSFTRQTCDIEVQISKNGKKWTPARAINTNMVGFGLVTAKKYPVKKLSLGWLMIEGYKRIPIIFVWRIHTHNSTRIGVRAIEYISRYIIPHEKEGVTKPIGLIRIVREEKQVIQWADLYRVIVKLDELIRSTSDLLQTVADAAELEYSSEEPIVEFIEFGSPDKTEVKIDPGIAEILKTVIDELRYGKERKRKLTAEAEYQELKNTELEIEIVRNAVKLAKEFHDAELAPSVAEAIKTILPKAMPNANLPPGLLEQGTPERAILNERLLPTALELTAGDDTDYEIEVIPEDEST